MKVSHIIFLLTTIIWIFPIFKQRNTEYFSVFFVFAISDALRMIIYVLFKISPYQYFPIFSMFVLLFLIPKKYRIFPLIAGLVFILSLNLFHFPVKTSYLATSLAHVVIALIICYKFFENLRLKKAVNLFLILFIMYEFTTVYKLLALSLMTKQGNTSFNIGTFFQFAFAIAFTFINVNTKNFPIRSLLGEKQANDTLK